MVEKIIINPNEVRGYGNIMSSHTSSDYELVDCTISSGTDTVNGASATVYTLTPTASHSYSLSFSSSSYTASGGSAEVSVTLTDNSVAVSGATVTFTGGTSTVTSTTNSSGVATATISVTQTSTITATYGSATDTCTITVGPSYLFYDDCSSSSGLSNYGTAILLEGGSATTMTYDSTENAYKITTPDLKSKCIPITELTDVDNFKFEADIKPVSRFGMGFSVSGGTGNGCVIGFSADSDNLYGWKYTNGNFGTLFSDVGGLVDTGYLHITVTVEGTSLDVSITDTNNTTKTKTATLPSYSTRYVGIGLGSGTSNHYGYIKNIKVASL